MDSRVNDIPRVVQKYRLLKYMYFLDAMTTTPTPTYNEREIVDVKLDFQCMNIDICMVGFPDLKIIIHSRYHTSTRAIVSVPIRMPVTRA